MAKRPTHISPDAAKLSQAPLPVQLELEESIAKAGGVDQRFVGEKERLRRELQSLGPQIERAAKASAERRKLEATVEAQKRAAADNRKPWIDRTVPMPMGKHRAEQKAKRRQQPSLPEVSLPQPEETPTPERKAKLLGAETITPPIKDKDTRTNTRVHEAHGVVEFYAGKWTYEQLQGARFLVTAWNETGLSPRVTANYDGTPVSAAMFGPRNAGLEGKRQEAFNEWMQIEAIMKAAFFGGGWSLVQWFVIETVRVAKEGAGTGEQMVEAGRRLAPFVKDKERLWGVTFGSLQRIFDFAYGHFVLVKEKQKEIDRRRATGPDYRSRLNAKGMGKDQLEKISREVDEEIAATRKGLTVVRGGKT